jgi:serine/threonine protein kinase
LNNFGLATSVGEDGTYSSQKNRCVIAYTAPEALTFGGKFTYASDVWSFGVLVWEMFSRGETAYAQIPQSQIVDKLLKGFRLPKPEGCPDQLVKLMNDCWSIEPPKRPLFADIAHTIEALLL